ncbi:uncharacterized protein PHALS_01620 [Plasmopara halstedii]|uniref:Uncharacterized protein n=1 Tax=Plasmopara halstedii TaxID=4781 RepID=A0A0N7L6V3_PLAHL|nr:uncharacterized protein PHALS_01620 [Plasmopara halstedii]CEG45315.1 hypothetical protein PHALS_01620 [Plasmopara halstedii]|eukprot:XP_024581684.1 hypothetical protein PHALS_01620 [Plasmopara halstedii]
MALSVLINEGGLALLEFAVALLRSQVFCYKHIKLHICSGVHQLIAKPNVSFETPQCTI